MLNIIEVLVFRYNKVIGINFFLMLYRKVFIFLDVNVKFYFFFCCIFMYEKKSCLLKKKWKSGKIIYNICGF